MKKILSALLSMIFIFSLSACTFYDLVKDDRAKEILQFVYDNSKLTEIGWKGIEFDLKQSSIPGKTNGKYDIAAEKIQITDNQEQVQTIRYLTKDLELTETKIDGKTEKKQYSSGFSWNLFVGFYEISIFEIFMSYDDILENSEVKFYESGSIDAEYKVKIKFPTDFFEDDNEDDDQYENKVLKFIIYYTFNQKKLKSIKVDYKVKDSNLGEYTATLNYKEYKGALIFPDASTFN